MMPIEKQLATMELQQFKKKPLELLLTEIYKYQKFKTSVVLNKINKLNFSDTTVKAYIQYVKAYLLYSTKNTRVSKDMYNIIDELKSKHTAILTPSENDRAIIRKRVKTMPTTPQKVTPKEPQDTPNKLTNYGIKQGDNIRIFKSMEACQAYMECFRMFNKEDQIDIVVFKYKVV